MREPVKKVVVPARLKQYGNGNVPVHELSPLWSGGELWSQAAWWWNVMTEAAKRDGITIKSVSAGYRSLEAQERMFFERYAPKRTLRRPSVTRIYKRQTWWLKLGKSPSATPGKSNHGWGLAQDIAVPRKTFVWMCENAPKYGFYLQGKSLLPNGQKNPEYEAWHWQFCHAK